MRHSRRGPPLYKRTRELVYALGGIGLHVGGHAANVAIDLSKLGKMGVAATGGIGDDPFGAFIVAELEGHGVEVHAELCEHHALPRACPQDH